MKSTIIQTTPAPVLALPTGTYCTEIEGTPASSAGGRTGVGHVGIGAAVGQGGIDRAFST